MPYLLKTEPDVYSFADLERDKETIWDGVTNPTAVKNLREMPKGEDLIIYHTGDERTAVGTAKVVSVDATNPKVPLVRIKAGKPVEATKDAGGDQGVAAVCGFPAGNHWAVERGSADGRSVCMDCGD